MIPKNTSTCKRNVYSTFLVHCQSTARTLVSYFGKTKRHIDLQYVRARIAPNWIKVHLNHQISKNSYFINQNFNTNPGLCQIREVQCRIHDFFLIPYRLSDECPEWSDDTSSTVVQDIICSPFQSSRVNIMMFGCERRIVSGEVANLESCQQICQACE